MIVLYLELTDKENERLNGYREIIKGLMSAERYQHSLAVEEQAYKLAQIHGGNITKSVTAALLHDVAKEMRPEKQLALIGGHNVSFTESEKKEEKLWHAGAGAVYVQRHLGIKDKEIVGAILHHTSGCANMNLTEKIVFVADKISKDRDFETVSEERKRAESSLEDVIFKYVKNIVSSLIERNMHISQKTLETYNCYRDNTKVREISIAS
ncbi:HD domain-containing protein [Clostridia bacterium]|nr:HD domain-containing protein [Clostridia bacterium]